MSGSPRLLVVLGSATPPGRLRAALGAAIDRTREQAAGELLDLADVRIAPADGRPADQLGDDTAELMARIADADIVVLATPVYRGSLTGVLKNLLDHVPVAALRGTPVGIVAQGASDHHYLGADRHLRDILTFFGAPTPPVSAYLTSADFVDGAPVDRGVGEIVDVIDALVRLHAATGGAPLGPPPLTARPRATAG